MVPSISLGKITREHPETGMYLGKKHLTKLGNSWGDSLRRGELLSRDENAIRPGVLSAGRGSLESLGLKVMLNSLAYRVVSPLGVDDNVRSMTNRPIQQALSLLAAPVTDIKR